MDLKIHSNTARELAEDELKGIAGGGKSGGPVCPRCGSYDVTFDRSACKVIKCNKCGYSA